MGGTYPAIDEKLRGWIAAQPMFFVATAPAGEGGHVNLSPKGGMGTFRVIDDSTVAYLDLMGSGIETVSHLRENGRITLMFCAFEGEPRIIRLYGKGRVIQRGDSEFDGMVEFFAPGPDLQVVLRSFIVIDVTRIADSCGFVVPRMDFVEERQQLFEWGHMLGDRRDAYIAKFNTASIDGLQGLDAPASR